jgi:hypothetical protein
MIGPNPIAAAGVRWGYTLLPLAARKVSGSKTANRKNAIGIARIAIEIGTTLLALATPVVSRLLKKGNCSKTMPGLESSISDLRLSNTCYKLGFRRSELNKIQHNRHKTRFSSPC